MTALVTARLKDEGYEVFTGRDGSLLPTFLANVRPDLIAMKAGRNLAIDIKERRVARPGGVNLSERARQAQVALADHPEWEYQLVSVSPDSLDPDLTATDRRTVEDRLARIDSILRATGPDMALVSAWATLEAAARWRWPERLAQPQMPAHLVGLLASEGYLMLDEERRLREVQNLRNRVVHGDLEVTVSEADVAAVTHAVHLLLEHAPADAAE
ncbi:hypothetical protein [uncultured Rhodospira sp.]|uniref:hypothetical protein n=1 Tax=uncultured Rhodospira sp. TaxID=1936189 RepID=UPI002630AFE1|nr:hypothetical protein [uncultured Rhodospira sp.]